MAFLGPDDILVSEKNRDTVQRIVNGERADAPVLDVSVANKIERRYVGISALANRNNPESKSFFVYLYYTESS